MDNIPVWSHFDYSAPKARHLKDANEGDEVVIVQRKFPGVFVRWPDGSEGWVNEWSVSDKVIVGEMYFHHRVGLLIQVVGRDVTGLRCGELGIHCEVVIVHRRGRYSPSERCSHAHLLPWYGWERVKGQ
jgi:hypothetical protein